MKYRVKQIDDRFYPQAWSLFIWCTIQVGRKDFYYSFKDAKNVIIEYAKSIKKVKIPKQRKCIKYFKIDLEG